MAAFAETLRKHIDHTKISIQSLANLSGVNRTHIQKMIKGERTPADRDILNRLIGSLMLTPEQASELQKLYLIARLGEGVYERHLLVKEFIEGIGSISSNEDYSIKADYLHNLSGMADVNVVYGASDINNILKAVIEVEASRPNGHIRMIVQPEYTFLMELLTSIGRSRQTLSITHIMCLRRSMDRSDENRYNVECIKNMAPLLVSGCVYNPMFYYDDVGGNINAGSIFPYMILTDDCVINISGDISHATVFRTANLIEMYSSIYTRVCSISKPMVTKLSTPMELLMHYMGLEGSIKPISYCLFQGPCLAAFFTPEIIKKYMAADLPNQEEILKFYAMRLSNYHDLTQTNSNYCMNSYFSEQGIDDFVNTGRITEIPFEYYSPLDKSDCWRLLNTMQEQTTHGFYNPIIIDSQKFRIPKNLVVSAMAENCISLVYTHPVYGTMTFALNEPSISYSVYDFMAYLKTSDLVISSERTQAIIRKKLSEGK